MINKEFYSTCVIPCCHLILKDILPGWCYTSHLYNTAEFGDNAAPYIIEIRVFCILDTDYNLNHRYTPSSAGYTERDYIPIPSPELNDPTDLYSIAFPRDILKLTPTSPTPELSTPYTLSLPVSTNIAYAPQIVLHPSYLAI